MKKLYSADIETQPGQTLTREMTTAAASEPLEVNVIFTEPQATAVALESAEALAQGLGASIHIRATIAVPVRLPLDQSPVSVPFMEQLLRDLVGQSEPHVDGAERTVHLYVCRDAFEALLQALKPNSLVVIAGRKHWWPTAASRMAGAFRANGHRVVFVDVKGQTTGSLR